LFKSNQEKIMALTSGFKKFTAALVVLGGIGGGLAYVKLHPNLFHHDQAQEVVQQVDPQPAETPTTPPVMIQQPAQVEQPSAPVQVQSAPQADPEANRGMAALLNAGKSQ
jgi:hypothetical protein